MFSYINCVHSCTVRHKCVLIFAQKFVQYLKMTFLNQLSLIFLVELLILCICFTIALCSTGSFIMPAIYIILQNNLCCSFFSLCVCVRVCVKSVTLISDASPGIFLFIGMSCYHFCIQLHWLIVDFVGFSKTRGQD